MNFKSAFIVASLSSLMLSPAWAQNDSSNRPGPTNAKGILRVALVTDQRAGSETKSLLELAVAELSKNEDLHLLERADVQRAAADRWERSFGSPQGHAPNEKPILGSDQKK